MGKNGVNSPLYNLTPVIPSSYPFLVVLCSWNASCPVQKQLLLPVLQSVSPKEPPPNVLVRKRWVTGEKGSAGQGEVQWDLGPELAQKLQKPYRNPEQAGKGGQNHSLHTETKQTPCASYGTTRTDDNDNDYTQFLSPWESHTPILHRLLTHFICPTLFSQTSPSGLFIWLK